MHKKRDFERGKQQQREPRKTDDIIAALTKQQKELRNKIFQSNSMSKIAEWKKNRNIIFNKIKKRIADIETEKLLNDAAEINNVKDAAQASMALKKIFKKKKSTVKMPAMGELSKYYQSCFFDPKHDQGTTHSLPSDNITWVTVEEVKMCKNSLKHRKATGPDGVSGEDIRKMDDETSGRVPEYAHKGE